MEALRLVDGCLSFQRTAIEVFPEVSPIISIDQTVCDEENTNTYLARVTISNAVDVSANTDSMFQAGNVYTFYGIPFK